MSHAVADCLSVETFHEISLMVMAVIAELQLGCRDGPTYLLSLDLPVPTWGPTYLLNLDLPIPT